MAGYNFSQNIIGLNNINKELTELTENKVDWVSNGVLGAKNLNSYPYYHNSQTIRDVVWTVNSDGSVKANGKAIGSSSFTCHSHSRSITSVNKLLLPNGRYILSGCPSGGSNSSYFCKVEIIKNGVNTVLGVDYGDGGEFIVNGDDNYTDKVIAQVICRVVDNYTADNLLFKPMIRRIEDNDNTYQPYAMTNKELTDVVNNVPDTAGTYTLQAVRNADNTITYLWV